MSVVDMWNVLHDGLVDAGKELLGRDYQTGISIVLVLYSH